MRLDWILIGSLVSHVPISCFFLCVTDGARWACRCPVRSHRFVVQYADSIFTVKTHQAFPCQSEVST